VSRRQEAEHALRRDVAGQSERAADVLMVDQPVGERHPATERRGEPARFQVCPDQGDEVVGGVVGEPCDTAGVHAIRVEPTSKEASIRRQPA